MKPFTIDHHQVTLERHPNDPSLFRILIDGTAVPMTLTETETHSGNAGSRTSTLKPKRRATWIPMRDGCAQDGQDVYINTGQPRKASFRINLDKQIGFYTEIWRHHEAMMVFGEGYEKVDFVWESWWDDSN